MRKTVIVFVFSAIFVACFFRYTVPNIRSIFYKNKLAGVEVDFTWGVRDYPELKFFLKPLNQKGYRIFYDESIPDKRLPKRKQARYKGMHNLRYLFDSICSEYNVKYHCLDEYNVYFYDERSTVSLIGLRKLINDASY